MKLKYCIILLFSLLLAPKAYSQTTMFGGNPQHTGMYKSNFSENLKLTQKWKIKTNGMIFSSGIVANGVVYFGSNDSCLYAVNTNGQIKWKFKTNGMICSTPAVKNNVVYVNNYAGVFYAISTKTGQELWSFRTEGERIRTGKGLNWCTPKDSIMTDCWDFYTSSPVIERNTIYFGSGTNVYAINLKSHTMTWKYKAADIVHSSPAVCKGMIYFGCWNGKFYALNIKDGKEVWSAQTGVDDENHGMEGIQSSPSVIDSIVVIGARDAHVYAFHTLTGAIKWKQKFSETWMPSSFAYDDNLIYTGSSDITQFLALDKRDGKTITSTNTGSYTFSSPAITNNMGFIGSTNGTLYAVDLKTGKVISEFNTEGRNLNSQNTILPDGSLNKEAFADINGSQFSFAKEYVRRLFTAGSILSTPTIDNNVIYFGSTDGNFYAVQ